jgi:2-methylcitrate dehydratase PrpD
MLAALSRQSMSHRAPRGAGGSRQTGRMMDAPQPPPRSAPPDRDRRFALADRAAVERIIDHVLLTDTDGLSAPVLARTQDLLLDTLGVAAAATAMPAARIGRETACRLFAAGRPAEASRLLFDGRPASVAGACFAAATQIDALDAHDGYAPAKGHAGVALVPAVLLFADLARRAGRRVDGREALAALAVGYDIACRAAEALHATAGDYHTSGAWNAIGVASVAARLLGLGRQALRHAWGIAEYHGPRSQMMRGIDHPSMLHDGSGWGALAGASAALMAADGFTGAPAVTVEGADVADVWSTPGQPSLVLHQYVKPHPVCFWAQSVVTAALALRAAHGLQAAAVSSAEIATFHASARLSTAMPESTEVAQYSLAFPLAAALVRGRCGAEEVAGSGLDDPEIRAMLQRIRVVEDAAFTRVFPGERLSRLTLRLADGRVLDSGPVAPRGRLADPLDRHAVLAKFHDYAAPLGEGRRESLARAVFALEAPGAGLDDLLERLWAPPETAPG